MNHKRKRPGCSECSEHAWVYFPIIRFDPDGHLVERFNEHREHEIAHQFQTLTTQLIHALQTLPPSRKRPPVIRIFAGPSGPLHASPCFDGEPFPC